MHGIGWSTMFWDLEFGNFLLAGVAGAVGCCMGGAAIAVDVLFGSFFDVEGAEVLDDGVRVDLRVPVLAAFEVKVGLQKTGARDKGRE